MPVSQRAKYAWFFVAAIFCSSEQTIAADNLEAPTNYRRLPFTLDNVSDRIVPLDFDGDGLLDLLTANEQTLSVYFQRSQNNAQTGTAPFLFDKPDAVLTLPGTATTWDVDADRAKGETNNDQNRIVAIVDGKQVLSWRIQNRQWSQPVTLIDNVTGFLPTGAYPSNFIRDINGDGLNDVIVPGAAELTLYLQHDNNQRVSGQFGPGVPVHFRLIQFSRLITPKNIAGRGVGQTVRIPELEIRDINSDGYSDLIANSEEVVEVFLAKNDGTIVSQPSYSLDLNAILEKLGDPDIDNINYSNLSGLLAYTYDFELNDINGDGFEDLLLREGGKISVFAGTVDGMDLSRPRQILKSAGNVLGAHLRDEDGDGRKDLWLMRVQDISLGNIFLWLAISGSIDLEAFVYKNVSANDDNNGNNKKGGQQFSPRPHRKVTVTIKFPSLIRSASTLMNRVEESNAGKLLRTAHAHIAASTENSAGRSGGDILHLQTSSIGVFKQVLDQQDSASTFLGIRQFNQQQDNYVINLEPMISNPILFANRDLQLIGDRDPDFEIPLPTEGFTNDPEQGDLAAVDLNADHVDDIFVFSHRDDNHVSGLLLLSR